MNSLNSDGDSQSASEKNKEHSSRKSSSESSSSSSSLRPKSASIPEKKNLIPESSSGSQSMDLTNRIRPTSAINNSTIRENYEGDKVVGSIPVIGNLGKKDNARNGLPKSIRVTPTSGETVKVSDTDYSSETPRYADMIYVCECVCVCVCVCVSVSVSVCVCLFVCV